jgi:iron complex transport system substrate-binding protein
MKKKFALLLVSVMAVGLVACGQAKEGKTEAANNPAIQTTEVSENTEVSEGTSRNT